MQCSGLDGNRPMRCCTGRRDVDQRGTRSIVWDGFFKYSQKSWHVSALNDILNFSHQRPYLLGIMAGRAGESPNLGVRRGKREFVAQIQLFEKLLTWPKAGEMDADILVGLKP